jgi:hypothetical protein
MATFEATAKAYQLQRATPAPATIVLKVNDFAYDWQQRPKEDICCGIRVLSADAEDSAKDTAKQKAIESERDTEEELKRQYLIQLDAACLSDPNDISACCEPFDMASDQLPVALTSNALLKIYDSYEKLKIETSPLFPEATDDECSQLAGELLAGGLEDLTAADGVRGARVRRYLRFVLDELRQ